MTEGKERDIESGMAGTGAGVGQFSPYIRHWNLLTPTLNKCVREVIILL